jgi:type I restriction enzyme M protein
LVDLPETKQLMKARTELLYSFGADLLPVGVLDRSQLAGAIAAWWFDAQYDLRSLAQQGFRGVIDRWVASIESAFDEPEDADAKTVARMRVDQRKARGHRLVPALIPSYVEELEAADSLVADLDARIKAGSPKKSTDDEDEPEEPDETLSPAELRKLKAELKTAKAKLSKLRATFVDELKAAATALPDDEARELVLQFLKADLRSRMERFVATGRRELVNIYDVWGDKYAVTLADLEARRGLAGVRVATQMRELGYA